MLLKILQVLAVIITLKTVDVHCAVNAVDICAIASFCSV